MRLYPACAPPKNDVAAVARIACDLWFVGGVDAATTWPLEQRPQFPRASLGPFAVASDQPLTISYAVTDGDGHVQSTYSVRWTDAGAEHIPAEHQADPASSTDSSPSSQRSRPSDKSGSSGIRPTTPTTPTSDADDVGVLLPTRPSKGSNGALE